MNGLEPAILEQQLKEEGEAAEERSPSFASPSLQQALGLAGVVVGLLVVFGACACGPLLALATALVSGGPLAGADVQQALALTVLGVGLGLVLATVGWQAWKEQPARPFQPRRTRFVWLALLLMVTAGLLVSVLDLATPYALPPINTLTMLLLPTLILFSVGRVMRGTHGTWRDIAGGVASGASLGVGLSMVVEVAVAVGMVTLAAALGLFPGGVENLESLARQLQDPSFFDDPQALAEYLSPAVIAFGIAFVAVVTPLVEEMAKTLGVGLAGFWTRPRPARAFLLGVASGAGFALAENLLNGAVISAFWGPGILGRLAATLMHCATGGLMGWGWGELWVGKKPWRMVLAFGGAVLLHGLWNGLAMGVALGGVTAFTQPEDMVQMATTSLLVLGMIAMLGVLALASLVGLLWGGRVLSQTEDSQQEGSSF